MLWGELQLPLNFVERRVRHHLEQPSLEKTSIGDDFGKEPHVAASKQLQHVDAAADNIVIHCVHHHM